MYSAISHFNDGTQSVLDYFSNLGVCPRFYTIQLCHRKEVSWANSSIVRISESARKQHKTLRAIKKGFPDRIAETERDLYTLSFVVNMALLLVLKNFKCIHGWGREAILLPPQNSLEHGEAISYSPG